MFRCLRSPFKVSGWKAFGFSIGDKLAVTCEQGRLIIEKPEARYESEGIDMVAEPAVEYKERRATSA